MLLIFGARCVISTAAAEDLPAGYITTIAGDTIAGYNGDNIPSTKNLLNAPKDKPGAALNMPLGVAVSASGLEVFIADTGNHRIRMVDLQYGDIVTVAGNGSNDFRGDGGVATNASINSPAGVAVDKAGNIYIADSGNHRVRKVDPTGIITTVAGSSSWGYDGDGGVATQAKLKEPADVAVDRDGTLYIADLGNNRIRRVDAITGVITTIAGSGGRKFNQDGPAQAAGMNPKGIALDGKGGLLIVDMHNHRIRKIDLASGVVATIMGTGEDGFLGDGDLALGAHFNKPVRVAVSGMGTLYISDAGNNRVRKVDVATEIITTIAGNGESGFKGDNGRGIAASLQTPYGIAVDANENVFVADHLNHRVRRLNQRSAAALEWKSRSRAGKRWFFTVLGIAVTSGGFVAYNVMNREPDLPAPPAFDEAHR
ncbi:MAG: hypothetical protein FJY95_23085 [Candidatus Handelsmanbacteria bacterium]|nr:hypothetical protein [Candidatus Handelsmanbacteria bacterium]